MQIGWSHCLLQKGAGKTAPTPQNQEDREPIKKAGEKQGGGAEVGLAASE